MPTDMGKSLLLAVLLLTCLAAALVARDGLADDAGELRRREFQALVGGLGFGPALDISRCPNSFDPRLEPSCPQDCGPVPCGRIFCPFHACSVFTYPSLEPVEAARRHEGPHADFP